MKKLAIATLALGAAFAANANIQTKITHPSAATLKKALNLPNTKQCKGAPVSLGSTTLRGLITYNKVNLDQLAHLSQYKHPYNIAFTTNYKNDKYTTRALSGPVHGVINLGDYVYQKINKTLGQIVVVDHKNMAKGTAASMLLNFKTGRFYLVGYPGIYGQNGQFKLYGCQ